jgi:hypothetical protein
MEIDDCDLMENLYQEYRRRLKTFLFNQGVKENTRNWAIEIFDEYAKEIKKRSDQPT